MAEKKISQLTAASDLTGTEPLPLVQGGTTKKATAQDVADLAIPDGGTTGQALVKASNANGDIQWGTVSGGGGSGVSSFNGRTGTVNPAANDYAAISETLTNKTISGASNTLTNIPAANLTGTLDGDSLPSISSTKRGGVPPTSVSPVSTKFLNETGTWSTPAGTGGGLDEDGVRSTPMTGVDLTVPTVEPDAPVASNTLLEWMGILWAWVQWIFMLVGFLPKVYNVKRFGAVGNGKTVYDAVLNGTTTITSATANFTSSDVGKKILVNEQLLTISNRVSSTEITVSAAVTASGTGKTIRYGTDNTAAFQNAALAAHAARGGVCYVPLDPAPYFIAGPLVTSDNNGFNPNSQIYAPSVIAPYQGGTDQPISLIWEAEVPPNQVESGFIDVGTGDYNQGTMVQSILPYSMISGTRPSVFGGMGYTDGFGTFMFTEVTFKNMWVRRHMDPVHGSYMTAFNGTNSTNVFYERCRADIDVSAYNSVEPDNVNFGFMGPRSNGGTVNVFRDCHDVGSYCGYSTGEHGNITGCQGMAEVYGIDFQKAGHASAVYHHTFHWCKKNITFNLWDNGYSYNDQHIVNLYSCVSERVDGRWYTTIYDVDDPGNKLKGNFILATGVSGTGAVDMCTKNGGTNMNYIWAASALTGGGGSSSVGPSALPFSASIPFSRYFYMMSHSVSGPIAFDIDSTGQIVGGKTIVRLIADGVNTPTFDPAFVEKTPSETYDNTDGQVNEIEFFYNGTEHEYTITLGGTVTSVPTTIDVDYDSAVLTTESPAHSWNVAGPSYSLMWLDNAGVDTVHSIPAGDDAIYYTTLDNSNNTGVFLGLDDNSTLDFCMDSSNIAQWLFEVTAAANTVVWLEAGTGTTAVTVVLPYASTSRYGIRIRNASTTPIIEAVYSTDSGATWSVAYTYTGTYSGPLYCKMGCSLAATNLNPKLEH